MMDGLPLGQFANAAGLGAGMAPLVLTRQRDVLRGAGAASVVAGVSQLAYPDKVGPSTPLGSAMQTVGGFGLLLNPANPGVAVASGALAAGGSLVNLVEGNIQNRMGRAFLEGLSATVALGTTMAAFRGGPKAAASGAVAGTVGGLLVGMYAAGVVETKLKGR